MRTEKAFLTLKEFAYEVGYHRDSVIRYILKKGKCRFQRNSPNGQYRIRRDWADEFLTKHTFGGTAYGKK